MKRGHSVHNLISRISRRGTTLMRPGTVLGKIIQLDLFDVDTKVKGLVSVLRRYNFKNFGLFRTNQTTRNRGVRKAGDGRLNTIACYKAPSLKGDHLWRREGVTKKFQHYRTFNIIIVYFSFDNELVTRVKSTIRQRLSARHVPEIILETKEIPYTASGKKVEVAVKRILGGEHVKNRGALANPNSLDLYYDIPELKQG